MVQDRHMNWYSVSVDSVTNKFYISRDFKVPETIVELNRTVCLDKLGNLHSVVLSFEDRTEEVVKYHNVPAVKLVQGEYHKFILYFNQEREIMRQRVVDDMSK